jgi:hypothetical protein
LFGRRVFPVETERMAEYRGQTFGSMKGEREGKGIESK